MYAHAKSMVSISKRKHVTDIKRGEKTTLQTRVLHRISFQHTLHIHSADMLLTSTSSP